MMGRVCVKHNEYAPDGACRWCEQPAAAAAPAMTPEASLRCSYGSDCREPATWRWSAVTGAALQYHANTKHCFCRVHHAMQVGPYFADIGWRWAAIEAASKTQKSIP